MGHKRAKANYRRIVLRLPDLDHSKMAVLNSLTSPASRRVYKYAIEKFVAWYCSEPRIAFNRIVVVRYRIHLESCCLAANTINQHLAAVRRLAHEATDAGLLSPDLSAGIARVKGVKQLGQRSGNWLTQDQSADVLRRARGDTLRAKRDYAMLAMLFGCGLRRSELPWTGDRRHPNAPGTLGDCRFDRQRWSRPYGSDSALGKTSTRRVERSSGNYKGKNLSSSCEGWKDLGLRHLGERCLVVSAKLLQ